MKTFYVTFSFLLLLSYSQPGYSQEINDTSKVFQDFSLQFRVVLFELRSFQGGLISFKYHFNDHFALRTGIGLSIDNFDKEEDRELLYVDTLTYNAKSEYRRFTFISPIQFLFYINPENDIKVFVGLGPYFTYSNNTMKNTDYDHSNDFYGNIYIESISKNYSLGLSSVYGVEWFITENMSLTAEYGFTFSFYNRESSRVNMRVNPEYENIVERSKIKSEGWQFTSTGVLFGISIYF